MCVIGNGVYFRSLFALTNLWDQYIYIQRLTERTEMPLHGIVLLYALNYPLENKTLYRAFLWVLWQVIYEGIFYPVIDILWGGDLPPQLVKNSSQGGQFVKRSQAHLKAVFKQVVFCRIISCRYIKRLNVGRSRWRGSNAEWKRSRECPAEIEVVVSRSEGQSVSGMITYKYLLKWYTFIWHTFDPKVMNISIKRQKRLKMSWIYGVLVYK